MTYGKIKKKEEVNYLVAHLEKEVKKLRKFA